MSLEGSRDAFKFMSNAHGFVVALSVVWFYSICNVTLGDQVYLMHSAHCSIIDPFTWVHCSHSQSVVGNSLTINFVCTIFIYSPSTCTAFTLFFLFVFQQSCPQINSCI